MTRIAVFSDSHGDQDALRKALPLLRALSVSQIFHLGDVEADAAFLSVQMPDVPVLGVCGNCDITPRQPPVRIAEVEGARIYLTHGHTHHVKADLLCLRLAAKGCQAALYGHTHRAQIDREDGLLLVNPGSPSRPRGGPPGFALLMIEGGRVEATQMKI